MCAICMHAYGQNNGDVTNIDAVPNDEDGTITITYDLQTNDKYILYEVKISVVSSSGSRVLKNVTGDVGENISGGKNKRIIWRFFEEMNTLAFDGQFKIDAEITYSPPIFQGAYALTKSISLKKGQSTSIKWDGGDRSEEITLKIFRDGREHSTLADGILNKKSQDWRIKGLRPGNYLLQLSGSKTPQRKVFSTNIKIKRKIPQFLKFLVLAGAAGAVYVILNQPEPDLPSPPQPQLN